MTSILPPKSDSHPSRSRSAPSRTHDEFYVATFWIYHERAISHILSNAKAFDIPGCDITFQVKEKWFKVICLKKDAVKVQDRFASLLSSLDRDVTWDDVIGQDQSSFAHPWILRLRQPIDDDDVKSNEGDLGTHHDTELAHSLEIPSSFQQYKFVRIFKDVDDLEAEGVTSEDIICHEWIVKLEQISNVRIAAPGVGRVLYVGGEIRKDVDTAIVRLSNLRKRSHEPERQIRHSFYTESSARDTPVEVRLCNAINPALVSGCILDPIHGVEATIKEYGLLKETVSIRALQCGPNGRQRSYFGPRSKGLFRIQEARRYFQPFGTWRYQTKRPGVIDGAASTMTTAGSYLGEKPTVIGWIQSITSDPPASNETIDSNLGISNELVAPHSERADQSSSAPPTTAPTFTPPASKAGLLSQLLAHQKSKGCDAARSLHAVNAGTPLGQNKDMSSSRSQPAGLQYRTLQEPRKPWPAAEASKPGAGSLLEAYRARVGTQARVHETSPSPPPTADSCAEHPSLGMPETSNSNLRPPRGLPASFTHRKKHMANEPENPVPAATLPPQSLLEDMPLEARERTSSAQAAMSFEVALTHATNTPRPFTFDMQPLTPVQVSKSPRPATPAFDDRETDTFHMTMRQMAPSRKLQARSHQLSAPVQPPVTTDPDIVFMEDLHNKIGDLLEHLRFRMGEIHLSVVFGRTYLKGFTREGLAMNRMPEDHFDWKPDVFLERINRAYSSSNNILFANILSIYGQDAEALHRITRLCPSRTQTESAVPWEQHSTRVLYEFTCQINTERPFVVEVDAESFEFRIRDLSNHVAPILIHCLHRHWDLAITAACSPVEGVSQLHHAFAASLVKSLEIPPNTTGQPRLCYTEAYHNSPDKPIVATMRVLHVINFVSPDKETQLRVTQVQNMSKTLLPARHGAWKRYRASPTRELADKGIFSTWFTASLSSNKANDMLKSNMTLKLGDEAEWTTKGFLGDGNVEALLKSALAMVKEMDGIGVLCDNGHGVSSDEVINIRGSLANVEFW